MTQMNRGELQQLRRGGRPAGVRTNPSSVRYGGESWLD